MKTAMQELWDILNDAEQNGVYEIGTQNFKRYIEGIFLEKEKEQIMNACNAGLSGIPRSSEKYYNETYD